MRVAGEALHGALVVEPEVFRDARGFFTEQWNERVFRAQTGLDVSFVQDNHSRSAAGVLRGLHYQFEKPQGKLVWVVRGRVFDVIVDLRRHSPTFGRASWRELSDERHEQVWIPAGLAHGFLVLSDSADLVYKTTDYYDAATERTIMWNDPDLAIPWPAAPAGGPFLSAKDRAGAPFQASPVFP